MATMSAGASYGTDDNKDEFFQVDRQDYTEQSGIKYVNLAILTNPNYGKGHGPINHLNSMKIIRKKIFEKFPDCKKYILPLFPLEQIVL